MLGKHVGRHGPIGEILLNKLRILVADDNPSILRRMCQLLETKFEVVATADNGLSALKLTRRKIPDVVVLELGMPVLNGVEVVRHLKRSRSSPAIVICSIETDSVVIQSTLSAGVLAYVSKVDVARDLIPAVEAVARGEVFVSRSLC